MVQLKFEAPQWNCFPSDFPPQLLFCQCYVNPNDALCEPWTEYKFPFFLGAFMNIPLNRIRDKISDVAKRDHRRGKCDISQYSIMPFMLVCVIHSTPHYVNKAYWGLTFYWQLRRRRGKTLNQYKAKCFGREKLEVSALSLLNHLTITFGDSDFEKLSGNKNIAFKSELRKSQVSSNPKYSSIFSAWKILRSNRKKSSCLKLKFKTKSDWKAFQHGLPRAPLEREFHLNDSFKKLTFKIDQSWENANV